MFSCLWAGHPATPVAEQGATRGVRRAFLYKLATTVAQASGTQDSRPTNREDGDGKASAGEEEEASAGHGCRLQVVKLFAVLLCQHWLL